MSDIKVTRLDIDSQLLVNEKNGVEYLSKDFKTSEVTLSLLNYKKYHGFKITYFFPDSGVEEFVRRISPNSQHPEIETFLNYKQAIDSTHCKEVEVIDVKPGSRIVLPCSKNKDCSKVSYVGLDPEFLGLNEDNNLEAIIPAECCVRVEFGGSRDKRNTHVKFFKTV